MMTESRAKPKAKGTSRAGQPDQRLKGLGDWRDQALARMRALILEADPEMIEERKWRKPSNAMAGVPVRAIAPPLRDSVRIIGEGLAWDN